MATLTSRPVIQVLVRPNRLTLYKHAEPMQSSAGQEIAKYHGEGDGYDAAQFYPESIR